MSRRLASLAMVLLLIAFLDDLVIGTRQAAMPLIGSELNLSYFQTVLLLGPALMMVGLPYAPIIRVPVIDKHHTLVMQAIILDEAS